MPIDTAVDGIRQHRQGCKGYDNGSDGGGCHQGAHLIPNISHQVRVEVETRTSEEYNYKIQEEVGIVDHKVEHYRIHPGTCFAGGSAEVIRSSKMEFRHLSGCSCCSWLVRHWQ